MDNMDEFCGSPYWNWSTTWYTNDPDFTECFEKTVLLWIPCAFLWICAFVDIYFFINSNRGKIPFTLLNVCKSICVTTLIILVIIRYAHQFLFHRYNWNSPQVDIYSPIIKISTLILALMLQTGDRLKGFNASGVQFTFWLLCSISESIRFRTVVRSKTENEFDFIIRVIYCTLVYLTLLLNCWADSLPVQTDGSHAILQENEDDYDGTEFPEEKTSFLSRLTFAWAGGIVYQGYKKPLEITDLWKLKPADVTPNVYSRFLRNCRKTKLVKDSAVQKTPGVFSTLIAPLFKSFGLDYLVITIFRFTANCLWLLVPQILSSLIEFTADKNESPWKGYYFAAILFLVAMMKSMLTQHSLYRIWLTVYRIRSALNATIYRKSLIISSSARKGITVGEIVNLMSVDVDKIVTLASWGTEFILSPVQLCFVLYLLYAELGLSVVAGVTVMLLVVPINFMTTGKLLKLQRAQMAKKDERVKTMNEVISGIKIIKLYAWEPSFIEQVKKIRADEISILKKAACIRSTLSFVWRMTPYFVAITTFATYVLIEEKHTLDAKKIFVSLTLFTMMAEPITTLNNMIAFGVGCAVSMVRITKFMNTEDKDPDAVSRNNDSTDCAITITNGNFAYDDEILTLKNINIEIKQGTLLAIVGSVGCGKTSILQAFLGEIRKISGDINVQGSVAYVPQEAWIQNATLRDNITFGLPYDEGKYEKIIEACCLRADLEILPGGDMTEIGEKGINLSGGQKQRVALARAAYNNADVYLFDDPLSSVDAHVGKHIFEFLLGPQGILQSKTRILVTHGLDFLPQMDDIFVIQNGEIIERGVYTDLLISEGVFSNLLRQYAKERNGDGDGQTDVDHNTNPKSKAANGNTSGPVASGMEKLVKEENVETGHIKYKVIKGYLQAMGWIVAMTAFFALTTYKGFEIGGNLWLSNWADSQHKNMTEETSERDKFLSVYGALGLCQSVFVFLGVCSLYMGTLNAAQKLHNNLLFRIVRAPMIFFDTTPLGRIVNRFSSDVQTIDQDLPLAVNDTLYCLFNLLAILVVVSMSTPMFIAVLVVLIPVYVMMQRYFAAASRQLFRLKSASNSPIFAYFSESLSGVTSIRAFNAQDRFIRECDRRINTFQRTLVPLTITRRWLGVRLEAMGNVVILCAAIFSVMARDTISPSLVGLSVTYALQISSSLLYFIINGTFFETYIVSAERILEYTEIDQEDEWKKAELNLSADWPQTGAISFQDYQTRYRPGLNLVLKGITCSVEPGEKIGIVGRTGAGKSSVTLGLFRIVEASSGKIIIDGHDIATLGLHDIRGRLTIIPQDPVLFSGTIRFNLDPFSTHDDGELWNALDNSHLKTFVEEISGGLDHEVFEGGGNLSVGQRQLVCLARAILRKSKILILDEATAAIDLKTDDLIQQTIRNEFKNCTVITIAHRLNTIMDSTRIIVLDNGEICEFDTPSNLLNNCKSLFFSMAQCSGLVS